MPGIFFLVIFSVSLPVPSIPGIELDVKCGTPEADLLAWAPLAKGLALKICRPEPAAAEVVTQSNAILRMLAEAKPDSLLYGRTFFESAQVRLCLYVCLCPCLCPCPCLCLCLSYVCAVFRAWFNVLDSCIHRYR